MCVRQGDNKLQLEQTQNTKNECAVPCSFERIRMQTQSEDRRERDEKEGGDNTEFRTKNKPISLSLCLLSFFMSFHKIFALPQPKKFSL